MENIESKNGHKSVSLPVLRMSSIIDTAIENWPALILLMTVCVLGIK